MEFALSALEAKKAEANDLYKRGRFDEAGAKYMEIICAALSISDHGFRIDSLRELVQNNRPESSESRHFLSTVFCNLGLVKYNLKQYKETQIFCECSLILDPNNYKAAYHIAQCHLINSDYNSCLQYVQRCQHLVYHDYSTWKNRNQPHLELVEKIKKLIYDQDAKKAARDCKSILASIETGDAVTLNSTRITNVAQSDVIGYNVVQRLVQITIKKVRLGIVDEAFSDVLFAVVQILTKFQNIAAIKSQFDQAFQVEGATHTEYVSILVRLAENKPEDAAKIATLLVQVSKISALVNSFKSLECLVYILDRCTRSIRLQILTSILLALGGNTTETSAENNDNNAADNLADGTSNKTSIIHKLLDILLDLVDIDNEPEEVELLDAIFIAIFRPQGGPWCLDEAVLVNMLSRSLSVYTSIARDESCGLDVGEYILEPTWYIVLRCLHIANSGAFKSYILSSEMLMPLLMNFCRFHTTKWNMNKLKEICSRILVSCLDFVELRQFFLDTSVHGVSLLKWLQSDVDFVRYIQSFDHGTAPDLSKVVINEYRLLIVSKFTIHSVALKKEIFAACDLVGLVPKIVLYTIQHGHKLTTILDVLAILTLHQEFKECKSYDWLIKLLQKAQAGSCTNNQQFLIFHTIANLLRSSNDLFKFGERKSDGLALDSDQVSKLREIYDQLPDMAKPATNGVYKVGTPEQANAIRKRLFSLDGNQIIHALAALAKRIKDGEKDVENKTIGQAHVSLLECFHYLSFELGHRNLLHALGVLRFLINGVNACKNASRNRYLCQSIAHLILAGNPANISYSDALDAVRPLCTLLKDESQLFQYEAALALVNLLSTSDDVRKAAWSLGAWQLFGDLLFCEMEEMQAAGLEGWCNLCAGDDVVHSYFYGQIYKQVQRYEEKFGREPSEPLKIEIHDINIMLTFALEDNNARAASASTGYVFIFTNVKYSSLGLLARDLRIAQYLPFVARFVNLFKAVDIYQDEPTLHRILVVFSSVLKEQLKCSATNRQQIDKIRGEIKSVTRKNVAKFKSETLKSLYNEIVA